MTTETNRFELVRGARAALEDLLANGIDYVPAPPPPERPAAASARATASKALPTPAPGAQAARPRASRGTALVPELVYATPPAGPKADALERVRTELGECTRCGLCKDRQTIVFGEGSPDASVVFVGEGPGADEDRTGRPFVGRAGELLTRMIAAVGWKREDVYICNIVKCRPPKNRAPLPDEVAACSPFLTRQIQSIDPVAIVTLGKPAASTLLARDVAITRQRGTWQTWNGIPLMPTFHPAYLLRNYTRETRQAVWDDLRAVRARIDGDVDSP